MLEIIDTLQKWANILKEFIIENQTNPFFWTGVVLVAIAIFGVVYNALCKD